jgi:hypothetical protein
MPFTFAVDQINHITSPREQAIAGTGIYADSYRSDRRK